MEVVALSKSIGAEIRGLDLSGDLSRSEFQKVQEAWFSHLVLAFRGQELTDEQFVRFSSRFGHLASAPIGEAANLTHDGTLIKNPKVTVVSNVVEDGVSIGVLGAGEAKWHTDMSYNPEPLSASLLFALEVPEIGGDTSFINMYEAYNSLPNSLRKVVGNLRVKHDSSLTSAGALRKGFEPVLDVRNTPGAIHPMVRTHPVTNQKALFLGRRRNAHIVDLSLGESERTLDKVWQTILKSQYRFTHQWKPGDLIIWDNRCTMHRRDPFDPGLRRVMHRTQIKGTKPF